MQVKLRRVRDKISKKRKDSVVETSDSSRTNSAASEPSTIASTIASSLTITHAPPPSLLTLPAEIRNAIYELLAADTVLTLVQSSIKKRPISIGLLVANKQTRHEYRPILLTRATYVLPVHDYKFGAIVRVFERLPQSDITLLKTNPQLWIYLHLAHVPSRDDRKALRAWCDYRQDSECKPYFGGPFGHRIAPDLVFQYNVKFMQFMRPPRPASRYTNGVEMKLDLLRAHLRMANHLRAGPGPDGEELAPSFELVKVREDLDDCAKILQERAALLDVRVEE